MSHQTLEQPVKPTTMLPHMLEAVASTRVESDPFPHMHIRNLFPDHIYTELLQLLPSQEQYEPFGYDKAIKNPADANRFRFRLEQSCLNQLSSEQQQFWRTIRSALGSAEFKQAVFNKLRDGLAFRYGCSPDEAAELPGFALPELYHETEGYQIKPHPDTRKKVVTMQIALPEDESQSQLGTEFYRRSMNPAHWLREPRGFEIVKAMPFLPNCAYAFVVLNTVRVKSWHGRSSLAREWGVRNSILNIWYQKAEHGNRELHEDAQQSNPQRRAA